ncbi:Cupredoxin [Mariannaea sp. PMI_226]|nr:Cupredoxin [Mariannaea sp. PMI_226]
MKYFATLALACALAPLSNALSVGEPVNYWPSRRDGHRGQNKDAEEIELDLNKLKNGKDYKLRSGSKTSVIIIWVNEGNGAQTTTINEKVTVTQTVTAGAATATEAAAAASHTVTVGGPGGLAYSPDQLNNIPIGDTVVFEFLSQNHTVTQSAFNTPCDPLAGGMDSGFMPNPNNTVSPPPQVAMQVMVDTPLWFYCRQNGHCGKGMVFSINPTQEKTQADFQALAIKQKGSGSDTPITNPSATQVNQAPPPAASTVVNAPPPPQDTNGVVPGKGVVGSDGSCICVAVCSSGSFPAAAQGVGAFGGMPGALPMDMATM